MASVQRYDPIPGAGAILNCQEGATAGSFKQGDLVKVDSSGQVVIATAGYIFGIAGKDATGTQATVIPVELIDPTAIYVARSGTTTAQADVGELFDFTFTAGAHTLVEAGATTDVYVVGLHSGDAVGTSGGRLLVRFLGALFTSQT